MTLMVLRENVDKMCDEINAKKMNKTTTTISKTVMVDGDGDNDDNDD